MLNEWNANYTMNERVKFVIIQSIIPLNSPPNIIQNNVTTAKRSRKTKIMRNNNKN